jgi:large subunit ribosomal protein L20
MRVKRGYVSRRRHKRLLKNTEGFRGRANGCFKLAKRALERARKNAYRHRKAKKRDYRMLWIARINAAARVHGLSYSRFICGLQRANVQLDRKILSELAMTDPATFQNLAEKARAAL